MGRLGVVAGCCLAMDLGGGVALGCPRVDWIPTSSVVAGVVVDRCNVLNCVQLVQQRWTDRVSIKGRQCHLMLARAHLTRIGRCDSFRG